MVDTTTNSPQNGNNLIQKQTKTDDSLSEWIRVSCAALCRIEHGGKFLLLLNRNRRAKGLYRLGPIGGALELLDPAYLKLFEAMPENAADNDLRLTIPYRLLPSFRTWFYSGMGRERSPFRELHEELVIEAGLLPDLTEDDVTCKLLWTVEEQDFTDRGGQTGLLTHYFLEVYDIKFKTPHTLGPLLSPSDENEAVWLTEDQITAGDTVTLQIDGAEREVHLRGRVVVMPPGSEGGEVAWKRTTKESKPVKSGELAAGSGGTENADAQAGESPSNHLRAQESTPDPDVTPSPDTDEA